MEIKNLLFTLNNLNEFLLFAFFLLENFFLIVLTVLIGRMIEKENTILFKKDIKWILYTLFLNTFITHLGYKLFYLKFIQFNFDFKLIVFFIDILLITFIMDSLMFVFHYTIHQIPQLYSIHKQHHTHKHTSVYSLYVLHPIETLGFGILWLLTIQLIHFNFYSIVVYLTLNLTYGMLGHLQKDIFSKKWNKNPITKWISTTQFHNEHHLNIHKNFGFYFTFWDKIFGTFSEKKSSD